MPGAPQQLRLVPRRADLTVGRSFPLPSLPSNKIVEIRFAGHSHLAGSLVHWICENLLSRSCPKGKQNVQPDRMPRSASAHAPWFHRGKRPWSEPYRAYDVLGSCRRWPPGQTNSAGTVIRRRRQFKDQAYPAGHCRRSQLVAEFGPMRHFVRRGGWRRLLSRGLRRGGRETPSASGITDYQPCGYERQLQSALPDPPPFRSYNRLCEPVAVRIVLHWARPAILTCACRKLNPGVSVVESAKIGRQRMCPARSTARETGASFSRDRCVRDPL
jgi:hypothetical protein